MVLERLVNPKKIKGKFWEMFFIGLVYSFVGAGLGYWIFNSYVSLVMVTFTSIAAIPFIHQSIEIEERKEKRMRGLASFKEHGKLIGSFTFLFLGFVVAFILLFVLLPESGVGELFKVQLSTISTIRSAPTGGFVSSLNSIENILMNNFKVLFFCVLFSFFYGAGAIFILSWNASVMAAAIGSVIRESIGNGHFQAISTGFLSYFVHGIPEISAYFVAALAGGIISVAVIKDQFMSHSFKKACFDSTILTLTAILILVLSALLEVFISPYFV